MSSYDFTPHPEKVPNTQPASSGGPPQPPPRPPKQTAKDLFEPGEPGPKIFIADYIVVKDLAKMLDLKPHKVVAELLKLRIFKHADEVIDFATIVMVARNHGFLAEKVF